MTPEFFSQFILYGTLTSATRVGTGLEAAKSQTFPGGRGELITEVSLFLPLQLKKKKKSIIKATGEQRATRKVCTSTFT